MYLERGLSEEKLLPPVIKAAGAVSTVRARRRSRGHVTHRASITLILRENLVGAGRAAPGTRPSELSSTQLALALAWGEGCLSPWFQMRNIFR